MSESPYIAPPLPHYKDAGGFDWPDVDDMDEEDEREHYEQLREAIEHHSWLYYVEFNPTLADGVYDEMFHRLEAVEEDLGIDDGDSPTQKVGTGRASQYISDS